MGCGYSCINKFSDGKDIIPGSDEMPDMETSAFVLYSYVESAVLVMLPDALRGVKRRKITYYTHEKDEILALIPRDRSVRMLLPGTVRDYPEVAGLKGSQEDVGGRECIEYLFRDLDFKDTMEELVAAAINSK